MASLTGVLFVYGIVVELFMLNAKLHKFEAIVSARIRAWSDKFLVTPTPTPT